MSKKPAPTFDPRATAVAAQMRQKRAGHKDGAKPSKRSAGKNGGKPPPPEPTADLEPQEPPFECYYLARKNCYYILNSKRRWFPVGVDDFRRKLRRHGISGKNIEGKLVSPQDRVILTVQETRGLDVAMPLAGHKAGYRMVNGIRMLVTVSPEIPILKEGDCTELSAMFAQFCGVGIDTWGEDQLIVFKLWLWRAWRQIHENTTLSGHCLILAGVKAACRTMLQERIITAILGGRKAKAALVFVKDKDFTSDLAEAEHLYLADELVSSDYRTRMNLAEKIKSFVANRFHSVHPKGVDQMTLDPRWRTTISLNDSPDRLALLPPLDDGDIDDKVVLLRCYPVTRPDDDAESEAWIQRLLGQLPAFIHECQKQEIPEHLREAGGVRFGFKAFRNPGLMAEMAANESESTALAIIDKLLFWADDAEAIEVPAHEIRSRLFDKVGDDAQLLRELQRLFPNESRTGSVLARIAGRYPSRVQKSNRTGLNRGWRIFPPAKDEAAGDAPAPSPRP